MDRFKFDKSFLCPGVYIIKCLNNNKYYIGSSQIIYNRLQHHKRLLETGRHHNKKLLSDYNAGCSFEISILQTFDNFESQAFRVAIEYSYILEMYNRGLNLYNLDTVPPGSDPETYFKNCIAGWIKTSYDISFNCTYYNLTSGKKEA